MKPWLYGVFGLAVVGGGYVAVRKFFPGLSLQAAAPPAPILKAPQGIVPTNAKAAVGALLATLPAPPREPERAAYGTFLGSTSAPIVRATKGGQSGETPPFRQVVFELA